jgi:hypothetical protein
MKQPAETTTEQKQAASEQLADKIGELCHGEVNEVVWVALMASLASQITSAPAEARHLLFVETLSILTDMVSAIS